MNLRRRCFEPSFRRAAVGAALMLATGSSLPATAQVRDTARARPFVEGGVYDKPYLARLLGRTAVGGYAEAHARWQRADGATEEAGFLLKRMNLFTATQVSDFVRIGTELEFEDGAREIKLEYAAIDIIIHPAFALRGGMLLSPLGRFNLSHDSPLNEFTDRPLVSTELLGVALSEPGFGALGELGTGGGGRVTYELYLVNGFHDGLITESPAGTRLAAGRANLEDNNATPALVGRVAWSPALALELGVSGHHGAYNRYVVEGARIDERRDVTVLVLDVDAAIAGFRVTGEAATVRVDVPPETELIYASRQRGAYLEVDRDFGAGLVRTMPDSYLTAKARLDVVDFDTRSRGDAVRQLSLGINFRPTRDTALKLDYVRGRTRDTLNLAGDHALVLFSIATYF
ncbi:MAG: hypothetical protein ACRELX_18895 [Longimicrobiales bacterium]